MIRTLLAAAALSAAGAAEAQGAVCGGALQQGGLIVCTGAPDAVFVYNGVSLTPGADGRVMFGVARDAALETEVIHNPPDGPLRAIPLTLAPREDDFRTIEGLDCDKVDARTPEQIDHAGRSWVKKQDAFADFNSGAGGAEGFVLPSVGKPTSPFGPARKYIGVSATSGEPCESVSVHRGYDMATPVGTPVTAPAGGTIILADPDLYYEGGAVFLDHGEGLVSVFMHLSSVEAAPGDVVKQGDLIAKTGNTGRTTGPHLHWAVKWRNPASDNRDGDFYIDPALLLEAAYPVAAALLAACAPLGMNKTELMKLREAEFAPVTAAQADDFARAAFSCSSQTDPDLRDKIGYEGLAAILRRGDVSPDAVRELARSAVAALEGPDDEAGFHRPFVALYLSEIVRVDRVSPIFSAELRSEIAAAAASYLETVSDYRGYDDEEGWRHGVAHTADVALQLALNDAVTDADLAALRAAIASKTAPSAHAYIHNEPQRLARPILFMAGRGAFLDGDWDVWFASLADPAPMDSWNEAFQSEAGLARLHNLKAFLQAVYISAANSENENISRLEAPALEILRTLP